MDALADPDDERELFVTAWCVHPDLIPDEETMAIPEPEEEHDGGHRCFSVRRRLSMMSCPPSGTL